MTDFRYDCEYDEESRTWDILLIKANWYLPYYIASFDDEKTARSICAVIESFREELRG